MMDRRFFAQLSAAAYEHRPDIKDGDTEVFLTKHGDHGRVLVVTFRGTTFDGLDLLLDIWGRPSFDPELDCWIHRGFKFGVHHVWPQLLPHLEEAQEVICNGHSKGGGEATIAAALARRYGIPVSRLVTQGSPFVGYAGLVRRLSGVRVDRYVHGRDLVAHIGVPFGRHVAPPILIGGPGWPLRDHGIRNYIDAE